MVEMKVRECEEILENSCPSLHLLPERSVACHLSASEDSAVGQRRY